MCPSFASEPDILTIFQAIVFDRTYKKQLVAGGFGGTFHLNVVYS